MMKKTLAALFALSCLCSQNIEAKLKFSNPFSSKESAPTEMPNSVNREFIISMNGEENKEVTENLGFGEIRFEFVAEHGDEAVVKVTFDNTTQNPPLAALIFRENKVESQLKKGSPKVEFDKKYVGGKMNHRVEGFTGIPNGCIIIGASKTQELFNFEIPMNEEETFELPFYIASYKPKDFVSKGPYNTKYKILRQQKFRFVVKVDGWSEKNPEYVSIHSRYETLIASLKGTTFCQNRQHNQTKEEQQQPYRDEIATLTDQIKGVLNTHPGWSEQSEPYKAYHTLLTSLEEINLDSYVKDCGRHTPVKTHNCAYCGKTPQQLYHALDDTYQQLYAGKITKAKAQQIANTIKTCYQTNKKRKKDSSYDSKIQSFYNRIMNY
ncbi:MAG: hypothetical protein J1D77_00900 [Muribaculaceae bacterium]|nr:hypothetical protein [Muribaculaceae bacterium]